MRTKYVSPPQLATAHLHHQNLHLIPLLSSSSARQAPRITTLLLGLAATHLIFSPSVLPNLLHLANLLLSPHLPSSTFIMAETGLPPNWEVRHSNSKNLPYYFNSAEKVSRWEPPQGTDTDMLKHYMATHHSAGPQHGAGSGALEGKIRAAHLLVKHRDSRRPSSWRESEITRSKDEAMEVIKAHEQKIKSGAITLADLAPTESDCSSARKHGDLGYFGRGDMQKEFEDAAFGLKPGEMSGVVETASGLHLIERLE